MRKTTTAPLTAEVLERQFRKDGYTPGVPVNLDERDQSIDALVCRRLKCPRCRRRGMAYKPYRNGGAYRVLAACSCGAAEEM